MRPDVPRRFFIDLALHEPRKYEGVGTRLFGGELIGRDLRDTLGEGFGERGEVPTVRAGLEMLPDAA